MKVAALDLGTNTFLCLVTDVINGQIGKVYDDQVQIVRLGQDVNQTKQFHPDALKRAEKCLADFAQIIQKHQPERVLAMATSAARDVTNSEKLFELGQKYHIPIEIIPGDKEAQITYSGSVSGLKDQNKNRLIVDIGGGSTELILGHGQKLLFGESLNIGCVRLTEMFLKNQPAPESELNKLEKYIEEKLEPTIEKINQSGGAEDILAVAGTPTELARIEIGKFDPLQIDGYQFTQKFLDEKYQQFSSSTAIEIQEKYSVTKGRADVITVGVLILKKVCQMMKKQNLTVSTRGVRYGVAIELAERPLK